MKRPVYALSAAFALATSACVGSIGDSQRPGGSSSAPNAATPSTPGQPGNNNPGSMVGGVMMPGKPGDQPASATPADPNAAGPMPLRRLSRREYNNTVRDLLGDASKPADGFPTDRDGDFSFRRAGLVATVDASRIGSAAEALATAAEANFAKLVPCTPANPGEEEACARKFVESFGLRAYRRPLEAAEIDRHVKLYRDARAGAELDFRGGLRLLIEAMLQSPNFIYRWELDPKQGAREAGVVKLGPYQLASRLSYALWGSMPDDALFEAAAGNRLGSDEELGAQVTRMLGDGKAKETLVTFFEEWFGYEELADRPKDAKLYPEWKDDLKAAMRAELKAFIEHIVFEGDAKLETLLGATFSFVNQPLAGVYGLTGVTGANLRKADLDASQRAGLLTTAGFLTLTGADDGSHPVQRGKMIYERLLCGHLPPPPPDVPPVDGVSAGRTTRERFAIHGQASCAIGCHSLMDPLGFAFEHYDGLGKYRELDNGEKVDASGQVTLDGANKSFANARELVKHLSESNEARRCFVTQMSRFAWSRLETDADRASIDATTARFDGAGHSLKELMVAIAQARSFRYRTPANDEAVR